jgi:hypothetical protein
MIALNLFNLPTGTTTAFAVLPVPVTNVLVLVVG